MLGSSNQLPDYTLSIWIASTLFVIPFCGIPPDSHVSERILSSF